MKTCDKVTIYKIVTDTADVCFHGYTTTSLASRLTSLKREADNPKCQAPVYQFIKNFGKENVKIVHVETLSCVTLDEVRGRLSEYGKLEG